MAILQPLNNKLEFPHGQPPEGTSVVWRITEQRYSVVIDAELELYGSSRPHIQAKYYPILRRTPKGVWIADPDAHYFEGDGPPTKFILLSANKRFAAPTVEDALQDYMHRRQRQIKILSHQLRDAEEELEYAKHLMSNIHRYLPVPKS